jgi:Mor family transcriptional regulator
MSAANGNVGDSKYPELKYPELLSDISELISILLAEKGVPREQAATIGFEVAEYARNHYGGHPIYIPLGHFFVRSKRDIEIFNAFKGNNVAELADKYNVSEMRIYQICKRMLISERNKRQPDLFGRDTNG